MTAYLPRVVSSIPAPSMGRSTDPPRAAHRSPSSDLVNTAPICAKTAGCGADIEQADHPAGKFRTVPMKTYM
jgi:hypothetical protein